MAKLYVPTIMRPHTEGQSAVELEGSTVEEVLTNLIERFPTVGPKLRRDDGKLHVHVSVFVNDEDIRSLDGQETKLDERDQVHLIQAMAGG
jgi:molybdopterin converting factor small subunit